MTNSIWTIFHRTGSYTPDFAPVWQYFTCWGGTVEWTKRADGTGKGCNRLVLRLRNRFARLLDEHSTPVTAWEAEISPGDLITAGEAYTPDQTTCWRITSVTAEAGGGLVDGLVITAE